ncbi:MAG: Asp-tRNA(Asn)/Glu-tRNA(Gln) amidotransferase subunit GatC [Planctomycetota bacterium]|nr:Asp-tRNA(Asn)/Glu-tRNA(Gln) amidotransferase subunit GatC [Planctomycetota bacterium]
MQKETIEKVALLARLELSAEEIEPLRIEMSKILEYADQLAALDTEGVEPLAHPGDILNALREDTACESTDRSKLLQNAPKSDGEFYLVPAVLGEAGKS